MHAVDRETVALVDAYKFLRDIAARQRAQVAALAEAELIPTSQRDDEEDEPRQAA